MSLIKQSRFDTFITKYFGGLKRLMSRAQAQISYDFWKQINNNEIANSANPARSAVKWYNEYKTDTDVQLRRSLMTQGHLYIFDYKNPKYKDVLEFFDTQPLVLCLGHTNSTEYVKNNIGINLHLLPPRVRRMVLFEVWRMFNSQMKLNLYAKSQKQIDVNWQLVKRPLQKYGVDFAIRSYIPPRQVNIIEFKQEDWSKAIWLPSAQYAKISASQLEKKWREHVKNAKTNLVLGESHLRGSV